MPSIFCLEEKPQHHTGRPEPVAGEDGSGNLPAAWFTLKHGMKLTRTLIASSLAAALAASASAQTSAKPADALPDAPQATAAAMIQPNGPTVVMDTSMGRITCQFYQQQAPKAVANFIGLAEGTKDWVDPATKKAQHHKPYYDGTIFHRVIPEFMIQGGDPTGTGMGDPGYKFEDEFDPNLNFDQPGRLAMANSGPNTNGSQFFITEQAYDSLNQHYTLFGQCDESSVLVVKTIARVQRDSNDKPFTPVVLKKVTIVAEGQPLPTAPGAAAAPASQPAQNPAPKP
jgi:peptidyl-prolyl cis-trans isomerase A (cyclophilin A)